MNRILDIESLDVVRTRRRSIWCSWRLTIVLMLVLWGALWLLWRGFSA